MYSKKARNREKVLDLLRSGMSSCDEIAKAAGVTKQVVMGIKGAWTKGSYMKELGPKTRKPVKTPAAPVTSWCYLIISHKGEVYLGATTDIRHRFRSHNSVTNKGYTKGRRWHLLATRKFPTRKEAFDYEQKLKTSMTLKKEWKIASIERAKKIVMRTGYSFSPDAWRQNKDDSIKI